MTQRIARRVVVTCLALLGVLRAPVAAADDAGSQSSTKSAPTTSARPATSGSARSAPMPAGHPQVTEDGDDPHGGDPHAAGHGKGGTMANGMFEAPEDGSIEDPTIPTGTLEVHIADADGNPKPKTEVTLGIISNSVAKGESRKRVSATTDEVGKVRFENLEGGSTMAYRAMVLSDGATFSAPPFRLPEKNGMRVLLHVYPVVREVEGTLLVTQSMIYTEVKDDRVQIQQAFKIYNFGKSAWVPNDLVVPLPPEFTAFATQQGMTDVGVDAVPKKGVKLHGTFAPGQHVVEFRWQLPYNGEADVHVDIGMTPNMAASRVIAPAARGMTLEVDGFPSPQSSTDGKGQRALVTEKQMRRDEPPLKSVRVVIKGLPTEGPGKMIATLIAAGGLALGVVLGVRKPTTRNTKGERERLLSSLASLEKARADGEIGPKSYERARRELVDEIAKTFAGEPRAKKKSKA